MLNIIIPLIIYPYLIRVVGKGLYGEIVIAQSIMFYFTIIINYGFNVSATKSISEYRGNWKLKNEIVNSVYAIKLGLFLFSFAIITIITLIRFEFIIPHKILIILTAHLCLFEFIFPLWYFQGIEKMKYVTIINMLSKVSIIPLFFLFVKSSEKYYLVPLINGIGSIITVLAVMYVMIRLEGIRFSYKYAKKIGYCLKKGTPIFYTRLIAVFKDRSNILLIGVFLKPSDAAIYDLAFKIVNLVLNIFYNFSNVLFPNISANKDFTKYRKIIMYTCFISFIIMLLLFIFSPLAVKLLGGIEMVEAVVVLRILSVMIIFSTFSSLLGIPLLIKNQIKTYLRNSIYTTSFYFLLVIVALIFLNVDILVISCFLPLTIAFEAAHRYFYYRKLNLENG